MVQQERDLDAIGDDGGIHLDVLVPLGGMMEPAVAAGPGPARPPNMPMMSARN